MKKILSLAIVLLFCSIGTVNSAPYTWTTWTDSIDFKQDIYLTGGEEFTYTHDLTDDGFDTFLGEELVLDYTLTLELYDDNDDPFGELEFAFINQPGFFGDGAYNFFASSNQYGPSLLGWLSINLFGTLDVTIQAFDTDDGDGDFYIDSSTLVATGIGHAPVPEPSTMLLMGLGLAGVVGLRRFRKK